MHSSLGAWAEGLGGEAVSELTPPGGGSEKEGTQGGPPGDGTVTGIVSEPSLFQQKATLLGSLRAQAPQLPVHISPGKPRWHCAAPVSPETGALH